MANSTGDLISGIRSRFSRPIPCSALIEPPNFSTMSNTASLTSSHRARNASLSAPTGWLTLRWMLPSPICPNGTGRAPGTTRFTAAAASLTNSGIFDTGTDTSCLIEPPSGFCTSGSISRTFHNSCAWACELAITASLTICRSKASASICSSAGLSVPASPKPAISTSTYQGAGPASGFRSEECFTMKSSPIRGMSSMPVTRPPPMELAK